MPGRSSRSAQFRSSQVGPFKSGGSVHVGQIRSRLLCQFSSVQVGQARLVRFAKLGQGRSDLIGLVRSGHVSSS